MKLEGTSKSEFYGAQQRTLQEKFDTRRLAGKVEAIIVHSEFGEPDRMFIDMLQDDLPASHRGRASSEGGTLSFEEYIGKVVQGEG